MVSIDELREIYDRYGEEILKSGIPTAAGAAEIKGAARGGYRFSGSVREIFEGFFGTDNPYTITLDGKLRSYNVLNREGKCDWCVRTDPVGEGPSRSIGACGRHARHRVYSGRVLLRMQKEHCLPTLLSQRAGLN
jgi:hypothetical protein